MIAFVIPSDFINNKEPDDSYKEEYYCLKEKGFKVYNKAFKFKFRF